MRLDLYLLCLLLILVQGRQSKFFNELDTEAEAIKEQPSRNNEEDTIHERLLKVNTKDYGRYDPSPAFVKPPFKLIPN
ncbi:uncharacterized protein LOC132190183 isoform X4 [Corylus avellana]|uniref:uncharacterized protein LOC132190183 isoform X4 n=1 Tax=Corylus avellana TaxID=13451 RepID=UPI00286A4FD7|nr:uncharacterized protein LOC132190183 isoform X4 [Corylus avellana]